MYNDIRSELASDIITAISAIGLNAPENIELKPLSGQFAGKWGYACSVSFQLAKQAATNPAQLAERIVAALPTRREVARVEAMNGYINVYLNTSWFANQVIAAVDNEGDYYGNGPTRNERIMVEFSQPNTHKAFHVGHLRNACLGSSVVNILRASGFEVIGANYIGDMGAHVIKSLWCYLRFHKDEEPPHQRGIWLNRVYVEGNARTEYKNEVLALSQRLVRDHAGAKAAAFDYLQEASAHHPDASYLISSLPSKDRPDYGAFADHDLLLGAWARLGEWLPTSDVDTEDRAEYARLDAHMDWWPQVDGWKAEQAALWRQWEARDPDLIALWQRTKAWSMEEFYRIYQQLNVQFDQWFFESEVEVEGVTLTEELIKRGIATDERPTGTVFVKIDEQLRKNPELAAKYARQLNAKNPDGSPKEVWRTIVLLRSDGTSLYGSKDIALARVKLADFHADRLVYCVDVRQSLYFEQVFKLIELLGFPNVDRFTHLGYEMVTMKGGAMSSRKGNVLFYEDIAAGAVDKALSIINEKNPELDDIAKRDIAEQVAFGALRFEMLNKDLNKVIVFDWDTALNFEGQSAPYIQYAHARACRVLEKAAQGERFAPAYSAGEAAQGEQPFAPTYSTGETNLTPPPVGEAGRGSDYDFTILTGEETALLELIGRYPDEIAKAAELYRPVNICIYLFDLADAFNNFYHNCPIIKAETPALTQARLALTHAAKQTLRNGLTVLGIAAPESM